MSYFNGLSEAFFKEDENGNSIFYKWGILGRGVIIDTKERKDEIISFISSYYNLTFTLIILMQFSIFFFHTDIFQTTITFIGIGFIMMLWYLQKISKLTHGLETSQIKLTMEDGWKKMADSMPRYFIWGGFFTMLILLLLSISLPIYLGKSIGWTEIILFIISLFGTYAYYRMITFSKDTIPVKIIEIKPSEHSEVVSMQWNLKNISILTILIVVVIRLVYGVVIDSKHDFDERMAKYNQMTTPEMAAYLAGLNDEPEQINSITKHTGAKAQGNSIYFYRDLVSNVLSDMVVDTEDIENEQRKMSIQLKKEMCGYPTYDLFYQKGGELFYIYHKVKNTEKVFLFEVKINKAFCL